MSVPASGTPATFRGAASGPHPLAVPASPVVACVRSWLWSPFLEWDGTRLGAAPEQTVPGLPQTNRPIVVGARDDEDTVEFVKERQKLQVDEAADIGPAVLGLLKTTLD